MKLNIFQLERYFGQYEFSTPYLFCSSDCESFEVQELFTTKEFEELKRLRLGYTESQGDPELRKEVSKLFKKVKADDILICVPEEGIFVLMNVLLEKGDSVIVQTPCYQSLFEVAKGIGCKIIKWEPIREDDKWIWDLDFLKQQIKKKVKLVVVNCPHNPTGQLFSHEEYAEIMRLAKKYNAYVFSDEMFRLLEYNKQDRLPSGPDVYEKCISLSGMSKSFGLPGLRIGWLSTRNKSLLKKAEIFKAYTTICNSALSELVSIKALKKKDTILKRNLGIVKSNLSLLDKFFDRHKDKFVWRRPKAGPIAFVEIRRNRNIEKLAHDLVEKKGVFIAPSTKFDYGTRHFRIGLGRENMPQALKLFEEYVSNEL